MRAESLRRAVCDANLAIHRWGLAVLTWGNASAVDRQQGLMAIKPSGVAYEVLTPQHIVLLSLESGAVVQGDLRPSSDTPTHLHLYRRFGGLGGIVHTHSAAATSWAQAGRCLPCYGTTHADHFHGPVPLTRELTREEIEGAYEENTGRVIEERFLAESLDPLHVPGVLVPYHGPFAWGASAAAACENARVLEEVARMALWTEALAPGREPVPPHLLERHFLRKHGPGATYGQTSQVG